MNWPTIAFAPAWGVERSFDGEPMIISQLVSQAIGMMTTEMIRTSLEHNQLSNEQMDTLAADLPTFDEMGRSATNYQFVASGRCSCRSFTIRPKSRA